MINPLICVPSPRDIKVVIETFNELKYDKLWVKYFFDELLAYKIMRNFFLEHKEYTHLVIAPDDLLTPPNTVEKLVNDAKKYDVISGICNFNCDSFETFDTDLAIDYYHNLGREYLLKNDVPHYKYYIKQKDFRKSKKPTKEYKGIKRVAFQGFALTFISRKIVEQVPFQTRGRGIDSCFSADLLLKGIEQYVDFDARSLHLKGIENCEDIASLIQFEWNERISTKVNFKRKVEPKLYLNEKEIDYTKYK